MGATGYACRFYFYPLNYKIPEETSLWYFGSLERQEARLTSYLAHHHIVPAPYCNALQYSYFLNGTAVFISKRHSWFYIWPIFSSPFCLLCELHLLRALDELSRIMSYPLQLHMLLTLWSVKRTVQFYYSLYQHNNTMILHHQLNVVINLSLFVTI